MERLTYWNEEYNCWSYHCASGDAAKKLAAYEATGFTPEDMTQPRTLDDWHEDYGPVLWWSFPIEEPPYCGSPLDCGWPGYHTHWTKIVMPRGPVKLESEE